MKSISILLLAGALFVLPLQALGAESAAGRTALEQSLDQAAALVREGRLPEALDLYERILAAQPDDPAAYTEAFEAYVAAGLPDEALRVAALAGSRFPAGGEHARENRRLVLHGGVRAGLIYDSNANQGPSSNMMDLGDWKNVEVDDAKEISSLGAYASANLDAGYRLNERGSVWAVGDASFYWRGNENDKLDKLNSREWQSGRAAAGIRLLGGKHMLDLRLKAEAFDYEFYNHVFATGPELRYIYAPHPRLHLITAANVEARDYSRSSDRNGAYGSAGEYARFFFGQAGHSLMIGASYIGGGAKEKDYRYDGWQGSARFSFNLPRGFTASPYVSFGQEFYRGPATSLETRDRRDDRWRTGFDLAYDLNDSWSVEAGYAYSDNDSRSELYTYDQHAVSMGVAWKF